MPKLADDDAFESEYMAELNALLAKGGIVIGYTKDRLAIDTGVHLFSPAAGTRIATQSRVWFQAKGKRATTLSAADLTEMTEIPVTVDVDHLRFWYGAPEATYLVVYLEATGEFIAEDVRDIVNRQWDEGATFYRDVPETQKTVVVRVARQALLDQTRLGDLLKHRSMRIDGPSFRGRALGHSFDPLRSRLKVCPPDLFACVVASVLQAHHFRPAATRTLSEDLTITLGVLHDTLIWQSPAFSEYGFDGPGAFRIEGHPSQCSKTSSSSSTSVPSGRSCRPKRKMG